MVKIMSSTSSSLALQCCPGQDLVLGADTTHNGRISVSHCCGEDVHSRQEEPKGSCEGFRNHLDAPPCRPHLDARFVSVLRDV